MQSVSKQYLTFALCRENYGIPVSQVKEVLDKFDITRVPKTAAYMMGVINIRGHVVPVIDLQLMLGMNQDTESQPAAIIVLEIEKDNATAVIGMLADSVHEVLDIPDANIEPAPTYGSVVEADFLWVSPKGKTIS